MDREKRTKLKHQSMIFKVSLVVITGATLVLSGFGLYRYHQDANEQMRNLNRSLNISTQRFAFSLSNPLYNYDDKTIQNIIISEMENKLISGVFIWEKGSDKPQYGYIRDSEQKISRSQVLLPEEGNISQTANIYFEDDHLGFIKVYMTKQFLEARLRKILTSKVVEILISDMVLAILMIALLNVIIISPIAHLTRTTQKMSSGELEQQINIDSKDEIGVLSKSLLIMRDAIIDKINILEEQKQELRESHHARQEFIDAMTTFNAKIDLNGNVVEINQTAVQAAGLPENKIINKPLKNGAWWAHNRDNPDKLDQSIQQAARGKSIAYNVNHKIDDDRIITIAFNLKPVLDERQQVKYLIAEGRDISDLKKTEAELEKHRDHLEELVHERTKELQEANQSLARLKTAIEQSMDGIAVADKFGNIIFVNQAWANMHGREMEDLIGSQWDIFHSSKQITEEVQPFIEKVIQKGENEGEVGHIRKDGTEFPTWMSFSILKDELGKDFGLVGIARDITKQKAAEEELAAAQKELISRAHRAGMADIATGTLHNVGNILNSVKTSSHVIFDIVNSDTMNGYKKANEMLRDNIEQLETFICQNPKGLKLMRYYLKLEDVLDEREEKIKEHLQRLKDKVDAISDVIAAQQSYAGNRSLAEFYFLPDIIDDALTMQSNSMERYHIQIEKQFQPVPKVKVQKTKLVHILINLIRNAKDAMMDIPAENRKLTLAVTQKNGNIFIKAIDTGVGIEKEIIDKIFSHGFTTKKTGHGFGLHSSANYMSEMGGRMWAESKGENQGATIVLCFPLMSQGA